MPPSTNSYKPTQFQKLCTLWTHGDDLSREDVVFNIDKFPELGLSYGSLVQIIAVKDTSAVRDFQGLVRNTSSDTLLRIKSDIKDANVRRLSIVGQSSKKARRPSVTLTLDESGMPISGGRDVDVEKSYMFVCKPMPPELKNRYPHLQVTVSKHIAKTMGFRDRMSVVLTNADENSNSASHVEITFRDEYLARSDMWRLAISQLNQRTVYKGQNLLFLNTIKATVKNIFVNGETKHSAYFCPSTKPIFRSESARYVVFIQMSKEMWDFDTEGTGEIMFNKVINGFLPELFKRWMRINARHLVSIILFTRVEYDKDPNNATTEPSYKDFYRVVVSEMANSDWIKILYQLKKEFRTFLRDVSLIPKEESTTNGKKVPGVKIAGIPTTASKGNILEAINLAVTQFSQDHIDRDLVRTGISVIVITPGTGVHEVDYNMLKLTTDTLIGSGIGIDLVCLSPMPLHSVPLFTYRSPRVMTGAREAALPLAQRGPKELGADRFDDLTPRQTSANFGAIGSPRKQRLGSSFKGSTPPPELSELTGGNWRYAIPHWLDVSFWSGPSDEVVELSRGSILKRPSSRTRPRTQTFNLRCRMYELQMMGVMENELSSISVPFVHVDGTYSALLRKYNDKLRSTSRGLRTTLSFDDMDNDIGPDSNDTEPHRPINAKERNYVRYLNTFWMKAYDDQNSLPRLPTKTDLPQRSVPSADQGTRIEVKKRTDDKTLKGSTGSSSAKGLPRLNLLSRNISFGKKGFVPAASVSINPVSVESPSISMGKIARERSDRTSGTPKATTVESSFFPPQRTDTPSPAIRRMSSLLNRSVDPSPPPSRLGEIEEHDTNKEERPSQPITIRSSSHVTDRDSSPPVERAAGSTGTINSETTKVDSNHRTFGARDTGSLFLLAGSRALQNQTGPKLNLSTSGGGPIIPKTLSPTNALAPWLVLVNPCNPKKNNFSIASQFRRWQHVFPRPLRTSDIKWKSLSSPASVPLTNDYFPTADQLATEYHESPYKVIHNDDDEPTDKLKEPLIRELVAFRLSHGFQIIIGPSVAQVAGTQTKVENIFDEKYMSQDGDSVYMSVGSVIHQLVCISAGEVEVKRYHRKPTTALETQDGVDKPLTYKPLIRTQLADGYAPREIVLKPPMDDLNWNLVDAFLAGYQDDFLEPLHFWRARFVLIPVELPHNTRRPVPEDSEEEVRLEGIKKLTQLWQRNRWIPPEERHLPNLPHKQKDPNPLAIEYQTRDPSAVVAAGVESKLLTEGEPALFETQIFEDVGAYHSDKLDLAKLAQDIQGEDGIPMRDRRWHWKLHYNCFVGSDLTTWLLHNFVDIESREYAVVVGNDLMKQGLFQHVQKRHQFRDGQYFYQIASEYRAPRPESRMGSWFGSRRADRSVPATPLSDNPPKSSPLYQRSIRSGRPESRSSNGSKSEDGEKTPTGAQTPRRQVMLSHSMRYDVGQRKRCYRPEIVNLHYDRLHNPDNCYHIRIDWMNVTSKLIEDAIMSWASTVEKFGLKLVELPIAEGCDITEINPFRAPYRIRLAVPPPKQQPKHYFDSSSFAPQAVSDEFVYHKALLRSLGFVLDVESAASFPADVDVQYSWGKPDYKYTQFIHKSGVLIAQITTDGDFLLLANRLYNNRAALSRESRFDTALKLDTSYSRNNPSNSYLRSPTMSPMARPLPDPIPVPAPAPAAPALSAEALYDTVRRVCSDELALSKFYDSFYNDDIAPRPRASPSPRVAPAHGSGSASGGSSGISAAAADDRIPSLGLPPSLLWREGSPMRMVEKGEGVPRGGGVEEEEWTPAHGSQQ
ncbi:hypothetical protein EJ05DRAFT_533226 [Pseudovirgaria hyperparasitica]|uniref:Vacuolar membrane-associated protein IML1 n=1 Tax=Pseudovirgaria hyperparasitica TaxID=470096 RepID=A0A6A6VY10_9PEZI|nr:uncharacterized protein EJ05DRAFT_533226 [Pseudovirgaria hyperparasitica]KAF2754584.1 hypothetical protein EJ05DRAFT_533226 [Pseudovirgaria hyperparasitica]